MARQNQIKHDSNARQDEKLLALRMKLGWEGYGLYWAIIEMLRDSTDYTGSKDYNEIAFGLRVSAGLVKKIVEDFGLFTFTDCGKRFYSKRLSHDMDKKARISEKRRQAAQERWNNANADANAMQMHKQEKAPLCSPLKESSPIPPKEIYPPIVPQKEVCDKGAREEIFGTAESESSAEPKQQSAGADILPPPPPPVESLKRSVFTPPTEEEVAEYAKAKGYADFEVERFVDFYASKGWYVGKNKMKDWRAAVRNWWRGQKDRNNRTSNNGSDKYANRRGREGAVASAESFTRWDGRF